MNRKAKGTFIALTTTVIAIIVMASCCTTIDSASVGIRFKKWNGQLPAYNGSGALPFISRT